MVWKDHDENHPSKSILGLKGQTKKMIYKQENHDSESVRLYPL